MTDTATPRNEAGPTPSEPRTRSTSGRVKWTLSGPVTMHVDPQSGATVIEYEAEAAEPAALGWECGNVKDGYQCSRPAGHKGMHRKSIPSTAVIFAQDAARVTEPAALDVERVKRAIFIVADNEEYDLQYTKEVHRLANDVAARLQSPDR